MKNHTNPKKVNQFGSSSHVLKIYRSQKHISAILIDPSGKIIAGETDSLKKKYHGTKTNKAQYVGLAIANRIKKLNTTRIIFDRSGYRYHGRVRMLLEEAKKVGLSL